MFIKFGEGGPSRVLRDSAILVLLWEGLFYSLLTGVTSKGAYFPRPIKVSIWGLRSRVNSPSLSEFHEEFWEGRASSEGRDRRPSFKL